jgi:hypothetical protein
MVDLSNDLDDLGTGLKSFGLMETQIMDPLNKIGTKVPEYAQFLKEKVLFSNLDSC